jgi:glycerol-3-phosphate O-acyltransferase
LTSRREHRQLFVLKFQLPSPVPLSFDLRSLILIAAAGVVAVLLLRWSLRRSGRRTVLRFRSRIDRFKFTRKSEIITTLLAEPAIADAVRRHASEHGMTEAEAWVRVRRYLKEIIPFFNVLAYYRVGYTVSRVLLNLFYKVSVDYARPDPFRGLPRDSIVIYLMNHRSNADYVLVAYALAGDVSISYAVGEWARAFPLEYIFKTFGAYFIRRRYREPLYHAVLECYVQLITRNGVTQGIFPEGGLTRDGRLRPAKVGLLDYVLGVARDPEYRRRMYLMPVAISYDRVLEDRSLLRELASREDGRRPSRLSQLTEVAGYVWWNAGRLLTRRWKRYGRAAVNIGEPISVDEWLGQLEREGVELYELERHARLSQVQSLCDRVMGRIGALVPVTPVALACAALQSLGGDFVPKAGLLERMEEMRDVLLEMNARVLRSERDVSETFDRAYRMLRMRRMIARDGSGYAILPKGRELINYYANGIEHLLGPWAAGVRERDRLGRGSVIDA